MILLAMAPHFEPSFATRNPLLMALLVHWPIGLAPLMFAYLLPGLLRYRRGVMAKVGAIFSTAATVVLLLALFIPPIARSYPRFHPWLFAIFYVYAAAGIALCAVGIHDRKRSAIWGMLAVLGMTAGALIDTVIRLGWASGPAMVPWGFIALGIFLAIGYVTRRTDPPTAADVRESGRIAANNRTRRSRSIPRKLLREGRIHLLPAFYLLNLSGLGREGIANSGSYEFADHIYRSVPTGTTWLGRRIDAMLLSMPATVAFRLRYKKSQEAIRGAIAGMTPDIGPLRILAIPCGLPRDLTELAATLTQEDSRLVSRIEYVGMDVDPLLLEKARMFTAGCGVPSIQFHQGNALLRQEYPAGPFDVAVSTGLGEFLDDAQLFTFYGNVYEALRTGGTFYTSASHREPRSDQLLRAFELNAHYRTRGWLEEFFRRWPWSGVTITQDGSGLQSFIVAVK